jgi:mitochondrial fission protein ELM1
MPPLAILILSDERPGHYHLAEGVAAAIGRRTPVAVQRIVIRRRKATPGRVLAAALKTGVSPRMVLELGYARHEPLPETVDLVITAGGDTTAANVAAARIYGVPNIFCGTLRHLPPESFGLVVSSYQRHADLPRHLVALKPSGLDPDTLPPRAAGRPLGPGAPPRMAGLLVGGPSGLFQWSDTEWARLVAFLSASRAAHGTQWIVSTSRRTPDAMADRLVAHAGQPDGGIAELIDFRTAGPGTLPRLFAAVEAILATEDSSTMVSEAVCARLPVVGVSPARNVFKEEEREYRALLAAQNWCRSVPLVSLSPESFLTALGEVRPLAGNHLDRLAAELAERLPQIFERQPHHTEAPATHT